MILALIGAILAADPSRYALTAAITAPPTGITVIPLPADLVGGWEDLDRSMLVMGGDGQPLPYTTVLSPNPNLADVLTTYVRPLGDYTYQTSTFDRPVDALVVSVDGSFVWRTEVAVGDGPFQSAGYTWRLDGGGEKLKIPVPVSTGPFRVRVTPLDGSRATLRDASGLLTLPAGVLQVVETLPAPEPVLNENGTATYHLVLPGPRLVRGLRLEVADDVFKRTVRINDNHTFEVQRIQIGGANLDRVEAEEVNLRVDSLDLEIDTDRGMPLALRSVQVICEGAVLVVRDAGNATLYAGTNELENAYDMGVAAPELMRTKASLGRLGDLSSNPAYVAPPTREGVDGPGAVLESAPQKWSRAIQGGPGWVRIPLLADFLAHAQPGLNDLRVVDTENREIPYLIRRGVESPAPQELTFTREEVGNESQIRVKLDAEGAPVNRVILETDRNTFQRTVEVVRDRGVSTETLRSVDWTGSERGHRLALEIHEDLGKELMIRIRNGDNDPLPITHLWVSRPQSELLVRVPEGGASLLYGAKRVDAPNYDLSLLEREVLAMHRQEATLGAETERGGPALTWMDRAASLVAMGLLSLGLAGMTLRVLTAKPEPESPPA